MFINENRAQKLKGIFWDTRQANWKTGSQITRH